MRITIAAVGRTRNAPEQTLCELYLERARGLGSRLGFSRLELIVVDTSRAASAASRMEEEAAKLLARTPTPAHRIALDEAGRAATSRDFAARLARLRDSGMRDLVFLIGGPDGLAPALLQKCEERLSFGIQTWPHLMVRAMLAEQLYRAASILAGHPYHRGKAG